MAQQCVRTHFSSRQHLLWLVMSLLHLADVLRESLCKGRTCLRAREAERQLDGSMTLNCVSRAGEQAGVS